MTDVVSEGMTGLYAPGLPDDVSCDVVHGTVVACVLS